MFKEVKKINFPQMEENILKFWEKNQIFNKSLEQTKGNKEYVFLDGPPFATGLPHYGHLVGGTLKDVIPRFWTMKGRYVTRRFGWDCHGLPVEVEVEKELNLNGKEDIEKLGIEKFNEACRSVVTRFVNEWETIIKRTGRWVDFENDYKTMNLHYMESIWWVFKEIWNKGYIKQGYRVNPFCPRCSTPLSKHEASQEYQDVQDPAITCIFKVKNTENLYLTAWTTTPWTLPSNAALAVHKDIDYIQFKIKEENSKIYIMAEARVSSYYKEEEIEIIKKIKGKELVGLYYEPLFDFYQNASPSVHQVINADYVSIDDGTGIVHQAPAFGQEDYEAAKPFNIPLLNPINDLGRFNHEVPKYQNMYIKDADKQIIKDLKEAGKILKHSTIQHSYPFCYRCSSPLIQKATDSWVMDVSEIKAKAINNNKEINWIPENIKYGRFGKMLEGMPEWHISRNRYWGAPLPIWVCECGHLECIGSIAELKEKTQEKEITDLHKHFVDKMHITCPKCNQKMKRTPEVLDCWFESGSMPYAQNHYPFENKEFVEKNLPADFIAEGIDQTRGWFNKLLVLSTALFDKPAFSNVIVNGTVLAEDGSKMSKSKKNYPPVTNIINSYGADAMRMYLINSPAVRAENLRFSETGVKEVIKKVMLPLWNSYSFLVMYANIDNWNPQDKFLAPENLSNKLDKWILSSLQSLIRDVDREMSSYKLYNVLPEMVKFIDDLTNWYIRRSRRRFWKSENDQDKNEAYSTLYQVLRTLVKIIAPVMPFIAEELYQNLELTKFPNSKESVHLQPFPQVDKRFIDQDLENEMSFVQTVVKLGRILRNENNIKNRQPLQSISVVANKDTAKHAIANMSDLITDELNVKEVLMIEDETELVLISAKANFRNIGKKFGKKAKEIANEITNLSSSEIKKVESGETIIVAGENICAEDMIISHQQREGVHAASEHDITVSINTKITQELLYECHTREFINKIANTRKDKGFEIADRIKLSVNADQELTEAFKMLEDYLKAETLTVEVNYFDTLTDYEEEIINELKCKFKIEKR